MIPSTTSSSTTAVVLARRILQDTLTKKHIPHPPRRNIVTTTTHNTTRTSKAGSKQKLSSTSFQQQQHHQHHHPRRQYTLITTATAASVFTIYTLHQTLNNHEKNDNDYFKALFLPPPSSSSSTLCEVVMIGPIKEGSTGILFPQLCNGMQFVGCGVRVKYGFVKVYAVGTYMDPIAMAAVKNQGPKAITEALLNPTYPRTIRIVMNRSLSIDKYTAAIVEALEPRMNGQDLDKLEEFKKLNPKIDLVEGAEMEMTIRGHTMLYKNSVGGVGQIDSEVFCKALCDVYYGEDAVSPGHKEKVIEGVSSL